ncbi:hypothetical protein [Sciscionella marina]|uniref:hypothetical protein n=1 Tax=Sciscionella marina TaxID=508770 RepID=UPI00037DCA79|nr:hypothetical protein [Sciscionella marina]
MPRILRRFERNPDGMFLIGLDYAEFSGWPAEERAVVDRFLHGVFDRAVLGGANPAEVLELLSCLAHLDTLSVAADTVLCALARYLAEEFTERARPDPLWPEAFRDWLYSDALYERITRIGSRDTLIAIAEM